MAFGEWPYNKGVAFGESGLIIRGVAFGENGLIIREVAFGESGLW